MLSFDIWGIVFTLTPFKVFIILVGAVLIAVAYRYLFRDKRDLWFARTQSSIINQRGALGSYLSLGYPICYQGVLVHLAIVVDVLILAFIVMYIDI